MAERWAVATGNWSDVATWDGGVAKPTAGDDVHANGFTVTINETITVGTLRTTAGTTPVAGGGFTTSGTVVVNADVLAGTTTCLTVNANGTLNGDSTGGGSASVLGVLLVNATQNGNSTGGSASGCYGTGLRYSSTQNGDSYGGTVASTAGTVCSTGYVGVMVQNGNSYGSSASEGTYLLLGGIQNGNSTGGSAAGVYGTYCTTGGIQNGNSTGGSAATAYGTYLINGGIQRGSSTGGSNATAYGTYIGTGGKLLTTGITDSTASGARLQNDGTAILGPGVLQSSLSIGATRYTIGNSNCKSLGFNIGRGSSS